MVETKTYTFTEVELSLKLAISIFCVLFCATCKSMASQPYISGSHLSSIVVAHLNDIGVRSTPMINQDRVFYGCAKEDIIIERRALSWKTIKITCKKKREMDFYL